MQRVNSFSIAILITRYRRNISLSDAGHGPFTLQSKEKKNGRRNDGDWNLLKERNCANFCSILHFIIIKGSLQGMYQGMKILENSIVKDSPLYSLSLFIVTLIITSTVHFVIFLAY